MKKVIAAVLILIGFLMLGSYIYPNSQKKDLKTFKVAYQSEDYINGALIEIATEKDYFKKEGLKIETDTSTTGISVGLQKGEVDATVLSTPAALVEFYNNRDIVFLNKLSNQPPYHGVIMKKGDFKEMDKAAVVKRGGTVQVYTDLVAEYLGNKKELDYVVVPIGTAQIAALKNGTVDFIVGNIYNADFGSILSDNEFQIISPKESWGEILAPTGVMSTTEKLSQDEKSVKGFIDAINKSQEYALRNPSIISEKLINLYEFSPETAERVTNEFKRTASKNRQANEKDFASIISKVKEFNPKNPNRSLSEFIDNRFAN